MCLGKLTARSSGSNSEEPDTHVQTGQHPQLRKRVRVENPSKLHVYMSMCIHEIMCINAI